MASENNQEATKEVNQIPQSASLILQVDTGRCTTQQKHTGRLQWVIGRGNEIPTG